MLIGAIAKYKEGSRSLDPQKLDCFKFVHAMLGWGLISASRIVIYVQWIIKIPVLGFWLFFFDIGSHFLYIYKKLSQPMMESTNYNKDAIKTTWIK